MSLAGDFQESPTTFLEKYVLVELSEEEPWPGRAAKKVYNFTFTPRPDSNVVQVKRVRFGNPSDTVSAYWLPWKRDEAVTMDLGGDAKFMFTCELTNCRFSVLTDDPKKPKVTHVAGTLSSGGARNVAEIKANFCTKESASRARRLSISGGQGHGYVGQGKTPEEATSAFVFGQSNEAGDWKFYAQVVQGIMAERFLKPGEVKRVGGLVEI
jgi:hypothetical protein